ncbi:agmatinase [Robiginitalea marina]|uniref:Agmatinase n=1 Tax=Robiginitalea marina TaxID=2954105 RepID=A0ABT1AXG3_9FLAO|nr:agmatinase [Robiginitalea marina]MCO5724720.1 agmatinase [Robiginitalea marina]
MDANVLIRGICYDAKSSFLRGPARGPAGIRAALHSGSMNGFPEDLTDLGDLVARDAGDFQVEEYLQIEALTLQHLQEGQKLFTLGGDHSITYPIVKALGSKYPRLDILHIDAHPDLYDQYEGDPYSHACPFARIMEEGLADRLVQVGIRTLNPHQRDQALKFGVESYPMHALDQLGPLTFSNPVYISLDMDALDPAFAPGVSHREPGGMTTRQVISLLQGLRGEVVGADLVEYNPLQDLGDTTAFVGAKLMKELLGAMARRNG